MMAITIIIIMAVPNIIITITPSIMSIMSIMTSCILIVVFIVIRMSFRCVLLLFVFAFFFAVSLL